MKYITGWIAFATPCELDTVGKWNLHKNEFLDEYNMTLYESDESPFGDWGIETDKLVDYHEDTTYNVANHIRAYVDMLYQGRFSELKNIYMEVIDCPKALDMIFKLVDDKLRDQKGFQIIDEFLEREYGNLWRSFVDTKKSVKDTYRQEMLKQGVTFE